MSRAPRFRPGCRRALSGLALGYALAACGPRVAPAPLDDESPMVALPAVSPRVEEPTPVADSLTEEDLPEIASPPAATAPAPTDPPARNPAGEASGPPALDAAAPSPLSSIGPATPPNVAAATRLADAGRAKLEVGNDAAALDQLERAIAIDPNNPYAYYFLAALHLRAHSYDQAVAFADRAAALSAAVSPEWTSRAWCLQGSAYEAAGRFADARQAYLRAVRAAPGNLGAQAGLARSGGGTAP